MEIIFIVVSQEERLTWSS